MLRLLLLSDIHWFSLLKEHDQNYSQRQAFLQDLKDYCCHNGDFDAILISGDIASRGLKSEYDEALGYINTICSSTNCSLGNVYVVPGNHDRDLSTLKSSVKIFNAGLGSDIIDADSLIIDYMKNDFEEFRQLFEPLRNYNDFALRFDSVEPLTGMCLDNSNKCYNEEYHAAYYKKTLTDLSGYSVNLYGMNSVINSDLQDINDDGVGHKLFLPKISYKACHSKDDAINIAMLHHPLSHVAHGEDIKSCMDELFHVQIFGHLHQPVTYTDKSVQILSGAFQPPVGDSDIYYPVYNIVELDVISNDNCYNDKLKVSVYVEKYNAEQNAFEVDIKSNGIYYIELNKHKDRWTNNAKKESSMDTLPEGVTVRDIRVQFLNSDRKRSIISSLSSYDNSRSETSNCTSFLREMQSQNRLSELYNLLIKK